MHLRARPKGSCRGSIARRDTSALAAALVAILIAPATTGAQPANAPPTASSTAAPPTTGVPGAQDTATPATRTPAEEAAETFQQGREAFKADEFAKALVLFQKSFALEATPGTLLNIALTEEQLGKVATALRSFERVIGLLKADDDRLPIAKEGVARVLPRVPRLKIERAAGAPPTLAIRLDGQSIAANMVGVAQPLDPGPHEVVTSVFGFEDRAYKITLTEGQAAPLAVEAGKRTLVAAPTAATALGDNAPKTATLGALGIAGAGIAGLGVGIVTGVLALSKKDELAAVCGAAPCNAEGSRILGETRTLADVSTGTLIFGGVATAAGVVMLFTIGDGKSLFVGAGPTSGGAAFRASGRF